MSQNDFLIRPVGHTLAETTYTGSAALNSTLSYPLTSSINCRVYNEESRQDWSLTRGLFFVSSSVSGGMFVNIPETKSVSLRMWGRVIIPYGIYSTFSLLAKHNGYNVSYHNDNAYLSIPASGYEFGIIDNGGGKLFYRFGNYRTPIATVELPNIIDWTNKWVGLRMDITPVRINRIINGTPVSGTFKDIVKFYTASYDTPDNWTQVGTTQELDFDGNNFVPWDSYTVLSSVQGANQTVATSSYGFAVSCHANAYGVTKTYFDDFQIFVEDAF